MIDFIIAKMHDTRFLTMMFASVAAIATVITLAMPLLSPNMLNKRMRSVALEREKSASASANGWRAKRTRWRCGRARSSTCSGRSNAST